MSLNGTSKNSPVIASEVKRSVAISLKIKCLREIATELKLLAMTHQGFFRVS